MTRIGLFRAVAIVEGVTTVVLFCVAMPMKYALGDPSLVPFAGMTHGAAWLAYIAAMVVCLPGHGLSPLDGVRSFAAGLLPFGTFLNDPLIRRRAGMAIKAAAMKGAAT